MTNVEKRLSEHHITLPDCPVPVASYIPAQTAGDFIFASGQAATVEGKLLYAGKVGTEISLEDAYQSARIAAIRCISELRSVADLDRLRIVRVTGFVNADPDFTLQPRVVNGASELFELAFGEKGRHSRIAIGAGSLPDGASVEVDVVAYLEP